MSQQWESVHSDDIGPGKTWLDVTAKVLRMRGGPSGPSFVYHPPAEATDEVDQ